MSSNSFSNFFKKVERGNNTYYNLCKNFSFDNVDSIDPSLYSTHLVLDGEQWTTISWKEYGTIELWWLIAKFNGIKNPFDSLEPGTLLKIPGDEIKETVLDSLKKSK